MTVSRRRNFLRADVRRAYYLAHRRGDRYCFTCGAYRPPAHFTGDDQRICDECRGLCRCRRCLQDRPVTDFGDDGVSLERGTVCRSCQAYRPLTKDERATLTTFLGRDDGNAPQPAVGAINLGRDAAGRLLHLTPSRRRWHVYLIGKRGTGEAALLKNSFIQDMNVGHACAFLDLQGDAALDLLGAVPPPRLAATTYFAPASGHGPTFNPLALPYPPHVIAEDLLSVFRRFFPDWRPELEQLLRFGLLTLLGDRVPHTLADLYMFYVAPNYREAVAGASPSTRLRAFWQYEFSNVDPGVLTPIIDTLGAFLTPLSPLERLFSVAENALDFDALISGRQILIANLSTMTLGDAPARLLAGLLTVAITQAARARGERPAEHTPRFYLYLPNFNHYVAGSLEPVLSEATNHGLSLTLAHEKIDQVSANLQRAIFDTAGTVIAFPVDAEDAIRLTREMSTARSARATTGELYDHDAARRAAAAPVRARARELFAAARVFPGEEQPSYDSVQFGQLLEDVERASTVPLPDDLVDIDWPSAADFTNLPAGTAFVRMERSDGVTALTVGAPLPSDARLQTKILERPQRRAAPPRAAIETPSPNGNRASHNGDRPPRRQRSRPSRLRQRPRR